MVNKSIVRRMQKWLRNFRKISAHPRSLRELCLAILRYWFFFEMNLSWHIKLGTCVRFPRGWKLKFWVIAFFRDSWSSLVSLFIVKLDIWFSLQWNFAINLQWTCTKMPSLVLFVLYLTFSHDFYVKKANSPVSDLALGFNSKR